MAIVAVLSTRSAISPSRDSWSGTSVLASLGNVQVCVGYSGQYENNTQATVRPLRAKVPGSQPSAQWQQGHHHRSTSETATKLHTKKSGLTAWFFICPTIRSSGRLPNSPSIASRANPLCADTTLLFSSTKPTHSNCSQGTLDEENSLLCQIELWTLEPTAAR